MRVVFIDADGCLHPDPPRLGFHRLCWLPILRELISAHKDVMVVMHSSWRLDMPLAHIERLMAPIKDRFVGVTSGPGRFQSILDFVAARPEVRSYRIIDDMPKEFPCDPAPAELILCPGREGITDPGVQRKLRQWLEGS